MNLKDFQYELPQRLIAQYPTEQRTGSRLMVLNRKKSIIEHKQFEELIGYFSQNDCIVFNDTRVIPARLLGYRADTNSRIEFLLLDRKSLTTWEVMVKPGRKVRPGVKVIFGGGALVASVTDILDSGNRIVEFVFEGDDFESILKLCGRIPLPPYIKNNDVDMERYQTIYSKYDGSVAAPTAGLHFSSSYLKAIQDSDIKTAFITLHVGAGTFKPVKEEVIEEHKMHSEHYFISKTAANSINSVKNIEGRSGRIAAVGTTSMRTLETAADERGHIDPCEGWTDKYIYPGYKFKCVDMLLTNFHLPGSTLIMLVCAFAGREFVLEAYREAIRSEYRFYSFGDAMLIV